MYIAPIYEFDACVYVLIHHNKLIVSFYNNNNNYKFLLGNNKYKSVKMSLIY